MISENALTVSYLKKRSADKMSGKEMCLGQEMEVARDEVAIEVDQQLGVGQEEGEKTLEDVLVSEGQRLEQQHRIQAGHAVVVTSGDQKGNFPNGNNMFTCSYNEISKSN